MRIKINKDDKNKQLSSYCVVPRKLQPRSTSLFTETRGTDFKDEKDSKKPLVSSKSGLLKTIAKTFA